MLRFDSLLKARIKSPSLSRDYFLFSAVVCLVVLLTLSFVVWTTYRAHLNKITCQLEADMLHVEHKVETIFDDVLHIMVHLGRQISEHDNPNDYEYILNTLKTVKRMNINAIKVLFQMSASVGWIDARNLQVVNLQEGILSSPYNMSHRSYPHTSRQAPWTLQFSKPALGIPSRLWVIPTGIGVTNKKGRYIGCISSGLNIHNLVEAIQKTLHPSLSSFILVDDNSHVILDSSSPMATEAPKILDTQVLPHPFESSALPFEIRGITYFLSRKMAHYPYKIIVGLDNRIIDKEFRILVLPRILELLGMGIFCLVILALFQKKIIKPIAHLSNLATRLSKGDTSIQVPRQASIEMHNLAKNLLQVLRYIKRNNRINLQLKEAYGLAMASDEAREEFVRRVNNALKTPLNIILLHVQLLLEQILGKTPLKLSLTHQTDLLIKVQEAAYELQTLTTHILNLSYINVNEVIRDSLKIEAKRAFLKEIKIQSYLQENLPLLYADELRFKQIIVGIIALSIDYTRKGGTIHIESGWGKSKRENFLKIVLIDDGFSLSKEDIMRLSIAVHDAPSSRMLDGSDLNMESIEKLVLLHKGTLEIVEREGRGKCITLVFPYKHKKQPISYNKENDFSQKLPNNVYNISTRALRETKD